MPWAMRMLHDDVACSCARLCTGAGEGAFSMIHNSAGCGETFMRDVEEIEVHFAETLIFPRVHQNFLYAGKRATRGVLFIPSVSI